jgi:SOS regulatory protein LexA
MKLNVEQKKIIELEPSGHSLVRGVAGSGKTTVAIHRMQFLQEHYCLEEDDNILLVTYNKTLLRFIEYQYDQIEDERAEQIEMLFSDTGDVNIKTIDGLMFSYFFSYQKRHKQEYKIVDRSTQRKILQKEILKLKEKYPSITLLSPKNSNFLQDEIDWMNACDIVDLKIYQQIDRIGRASGEEGPQKLGKDSKTREAIFNLKEHYEEALKQENLVDFKMMNKMALEEVEQSTSKKYTHILIDESQDLSKVQLKFLNHLHADKSYASIMFVADNTQSIYAHSWLGKGRPYTTIGYDMSGKSRTLSKNYRTTTEISKAAYALIEHDEEIKNNVDFVKPALIDRHGHPPIYRFFLNEQQQAKYIVEEINSLKHDYNLKDICIVAKEKRLVENTKIVLEDEGISSALLYDKDTKFNHESVKLTTMHSIKGLEFKVIFLIHLDSGVIPNETYQLDEDSYSEERKLLYVGMTRANDLLYMSSVRKASRFIKELAIPSLRMKKDSKFRPFKTLPIQEYRFKDQLIDLNSKEEVVRQWLLKELNEVFGYPYELAELEYEVQHYSKKGYVDLALMIDRNGERLPYIFAEVKQFGEELTSARKQLESYLQANQHVRYGIVTNGLEVVVVDRNMTPVNDVPPCQPAFLPQSKHKFMYHDLRHDYKYEYLQDKEDKENIEVVELSDQLILSETPSVKVPVIGDVAAGIPTTAIEEFEEEILLMDSWVIRPSSTFALRVTGDSMINAGIDKGDIVVVHKQETVNNQDICIALIDDEATMKRFMLMGSTVLLISENSNYEPIQMNAEDVKINGKVIGVLKQ